MCEFGGHVELPILGSIGRGSSGKILCGFGEHFEIHLYLGLWGLLVIYCVSCLEAGGTVQISFSRKNRIPFSSTHFD